jgi:hypothetical protein
VSVSDVARVIRDYFVDLHSCRGCQAKDKLAIILQEEMHKKNEMIDFLQKSLLEENVNKQEMIDYFSGKARTQQSQPSTMHSLPRNQGIQSRIRHAERIDAEQAVQLTAERKKEYTERIRQMEKPEIEVMENGK